MPKPYPKEFRDDVVAVPRTGQAPINQIAKDFGISEACLHNWLKNAEVEDGLRPDLIDAERAELREVKKRNRLFDSQPPGRPPAGAEQERPALAKPEGACRGLSPDPRGACGH